MGSISSAFLDRIAESRRTLCHPAMSVARGVVGYRQSSVSVELQLIQPFRSLGQPFFFRSSIGRMKPAVVVALAIEALTSYVSRDSAQRHGSRFQRV